MFKTMRLEHQATERGDATRERILGAALRLFRRRGFERATMREIARAGGRASVAAAARPRRARALAGAPGADPVLHPRHLPRCGADAPPRGANRRGLLLGAPAGLSSRRHASRR